MLKLFYDWLILPPADVIAGLVLLPIMVAPFIATIAIWYFTVNILGDTGRPKRISTYFIAGIISAYVLMVTVTAVSRLPHAYNQMMRDDD